MVELGFISRRYVDVGGLYTMSCPYTFPDDQASLEIQPKPEMRPPRTHSRCWILFSDEERTNEVLRNGHGWVRREPFGNCRSGPAVNRGASVDGNPDRRMSAHERSGPLCCRS